MNADQIVQENLELAEALLGVYRVFVEGETIKFQASEFDERRNYLFLEESNAAVARECGEDGWKWGAYDGKLYDVVDAPVFIVPAASPDAETACYHTIASAIEKLAALILMKKEVGL